MDTAVAEQVSSRRARPIPTVEQSLHKQVEAAKILREQIADLAAGDPDFIRDTIEGETSLHEMIGAVTFSVLDDEALASGIAKLMADLDVRKDRIERRAEAKRALIASAMEIGEVSKLETPAGTVSTRPVPPKVIITEEADIPAKYWKTADPKLDKRAVLDALKARQSAISDALAKDEPHERIAAMADANASHPEIPGAVLSNGSRTISIRVR